MKFTDGTARGSAGDSPGLPLIIATMLRAEGRTGVHTHVRELRRYLAGTGGGSALLTPFSWGRALAVPVFGARLLIEGVSGTASVAWYRYWHELFLRQALRRRLARTGACVVYAQDPLSARAALRARRGPGQRVVLAVHFRISQSDEWADKRQIPWDGVMFRGIRRAERQILPAVDGLVYVSDWARRALLAWLPEAAAVPSAVIGNFVAPLRGRPDHGPQGDLVTIGHLEPVKNHRFLLEVLAQARRRGRRLTLDIFGEGPLRRELQQRAQALGVAEQVRFRGFRRDMREFLPSYLAYAHASWSESSSLAIMEAMAAGLPVVAAGIGPIPELCEDGAEARFWDLGDPAGAAGLLLALLDDEPARQKAAAAARQRFRRDHHADRMGSRLESFLLDTGQPAVSPAGREAAGR